MAKQTGFIVLAVDDANVKINFPQMKADIAYILDYILQYYAPEFKSYKQTLDVLGKDLPKDVVAY